MHPLASIIRDVEGCFNCGIMAPFGVPHIGTVLYEGSQRNGDVGGVCWDM